LNNLFNVFTAKTFPINILDLRTELFRKSIHMLIAMVPMIAAIDKGVALALLGGGAVIYTYSEILRAQGCSLLFISSIKSFALREKDINSFAAGPVTLAFGAMAALIFYPSDVAKIAIYALAFGDGFASIVGKVFGATKIPFTGGKSLEGRLACFFAVLVSTFKITSNIGVSFTTALVVTVVEVFPLGDFDNFIIPIVAGTTALVMLG
jgi:dolichol kinase